MKLDVTAELDGFYADACRSVFVGHAAAAHACGSCARPSARWLER